MDQNHPAADDSGAGSSDKPFKTISRGAKIVQAGDIVTVRKGVYREFVQLQSSGVEGKPIVFKAETPGSVIVNGAKVIPLADISSVPGKEPLYQIAWTEDFPIDVTPAGKVFVHPPDQPLFGRPELMLCDGDVLLPVASEDELRRNYHKWNGVAQGPIPNLGKFSGAVFFDIPNHRAIFWLNRGGDPKNHLIELCNQPQLFGTDPWRTPQGLSFIQVSGFVFRHCANYAQRPAVWLPGKTNWMEDCIIETVAGQGLSIDGLMRRCIIRNCGATGGSARGPDFAIFNCLWEGNCWKPYDRGWEAGGAKITESSNGIITKCVFRNNGGPGLWLDIDVRDTSIDQCAFIDNEGSGLLVEISRGITINRSLFRGNGVGKVGRYSPTDWGNGGITLAETMNSTVMHCTIMDNSDGIVLREQGPRRIDLKEGGTLDFHCENIKFDHNHVANNLGYQLALYWDNLFFGPHPAKKGADSNDTIYDPAQQKIKLMQNHFAAAPGQRLVLHGAPWRSKSQKLDSCNTLGESTFLKDQRSFPIVPQKGWKDAPADVDEWLKTFHLPRD